MGRRLRQALHRHVPVLAKTYGAQLYPFFLAGVALDPSLNQSDGLHPTAEGVQKIVEAMLPDVEALIERVKTRRGQAS